MYLIGPLRVGVYAFPVLIIAFAVLSGACSLARALGDGGAAIFLSRVAIVTLLLFAIDLISLVGILAIRALPEHDSDVDDRP